MRKRVSAAIVLTLGGLGIVNCSSTSSPGTANSPQSAAGTGQSAAGAAKPQTSLNAHLSPSSVSAQTMAKGTRIDGPQIELVRDKNGIRRHGALGAVELSRLRGTASAAWSGQERPNFASNPTEGDNFNMRRYRSPAPLAISRCGPRSIQGQIGPLPIQPPCGRRKGPSGQTYDGERVCETGE